MILLVQRCLIKYWSRTHVLQVVCMSSWSTVTMGVFAIISSNSVVTSSALLTALSAKTCRWMRRNWWWARMRWGTWRQPSLHVEITSMTDRWLWRTLFALPSKLQEAWNTCIQRRYRFHFKFSRFWNLSTIQQIFSALLGRMGVFMWISWFKPSLKYIRFCYKGLKMHKNRPGINGKILFLSTPLMGRP